MLAWGNYSMLQDFRPMETEFFHAEERTGGQREVAKLIMAFGYFASTPKSVFLYVYGVTNRLFILIKYVSEVKGKKYTIVCLVLYLSACSLIFYSLRTNTGFMK